MKTKLTSGVLCRDKATPQLITFWSPDQNTVESGDMILSKDGWWDCSWSNRHLIWLLVQWEELYQLYDENGKKIPPPKPGECFEVEIEL